MVKAKPVTVFTAITFIKVDYQNLEDLVKVIIMVVYFKVVVVVIAFIKVIVAIESKVITFTTVATIVAT